jgi:hypothetical protein
MKEMRSRATVLAHSLNSSFFSLSDLSFFSIVKAGSMAHFLFELKDEESGDDETGRLTAAAEYCSRVLLGMDQCPRKGWRTRVGRRRSRSIVRTEEKGSVVTQTL